jgi:WD40 repeat protein
MLIIDDIIYCGCTDNSIQEIDTTTGAVVSIQAGMRLLRGKKPIYAMQVYQDLLFTAGAFVEGGGTKVWQRLTRVLVTSVPTQSDVRAMAVSDDFLYLASNLPGGTIEVWLRARLTKVATLNVGSKVTALSLVGETLYSGSEDGKIRAFALNS